MHQDNVSHDQLTGGNINNILIMGIMWLIAVVLAMMSIFAVRELFIWAASHVFMVAMDGPAGRYQISGAINAVHYCLVSAVGIFFMGVVVVISEYVFRNANRPATLRLLSRIIIAECLLVIPVAVLFWR